MGTSDVALLHEVNGRCSEALVAAAGKAGLQRIVLVSTMAALRPDDGPYAASKARGQRALRSFEGIGIALQPPLIYGPRSQVTSAISGLARFGLVPAIKSGALLYPVHVDDVAAACIEAALREGLSNGSYPLPGPDAYSFPSFARRVLRAVGSHARVLPLPATLSLGLARTMEATMARPILTRESVLAVLQGSVTGDGGAAAAALGFAPRGLDAGLRGLMHR